MFRKVLTLSLLALAFSCPPAWGQKKAVPLRIEGDTVVVVRSLPCKVVAAPGADLYVWSVPDTVKASEESDGVLSIAAAPKGTFTIRVVSLRIDFDSKKIIKERGEIDVSYGDGPGPTPPPPPPPPPVDPVVKALQTAYDAETAGDKHETIKSLALVYTAAARLVRSGKVATAGQLWTSIAAGQDAVAVKGKIKGVQQALKAQLFDDLPSKSSDKIDSSNIEVFGRAFDAAVVALGKVQTKKEGKQ